eukprot:symbB.v1.2.033840.t1/scaffold4260.1/size42279/5
MAPRGLRLAGAMLPLAGAQSVSCAAVGQGYKDAMAKAPALPNGAFLTDALQCQASCASNPTCIHFTWFTDTHGCWLGSESDSLVVAPKVGMLFRLGRWQPFTRQCDFQAISGPKTCKAPEPTAPTPAPALAPAPATPAPVVSSAGDETPRQTPKALAQNTFSRGLTHPTLWWALGAGVVLLAILAALAFAQGKKKPKESARKRHMRRTQGMEEVPEEDGEEPDVERPLMPWEQRKLQSGSNGTKMGFQAPDSFMRLPLTAQAPVSFQPQHPMEATQQFPGLPSHRYISFYPPRGSRQSTGETCDPEAVWRAACLIPEGYDLSTNSSNVDADPSFRMDDQAEDDLVLLREPRRRLGARRAAPQPAARTRPGVSQSSQEPAKTPAAPAPRVARGVAGEPAPEPPAGEAEAEVRSGRIEEIEIDSTNCSKVVEGPKLTKVNETNLKLGSSLVDLIDRGIYGMGPAGRRARSAQRSDLPGRWDQGTKASLQKARARSVQSRSVDVQSDPWAEYFGETERSVKTVPVWGELPFRLHRRQHMVVKESEAELTTGHIPVLRDESIDCLLGGPDGIDGYYADGTFGRGGHSTEILRRLSKDGRLWAFDLDPNAVAVGQKLAAMDSRFKILHRPFADVQVSLPDVELSGMLLDIGFSSPQVDDGDRGWSCYQDGPLDLRMNFKAGIPAWKWLQTCRTPGELASVIYENGEDDDPVMCHRIAEAALERQRRLGPYTSTLELATCVQEVKGGLDERRQHPAKLAFQGIRNFINQEMQQLADAMAAQFERLKFGGRAVVITFKPREEQVLEDWLRRNEDGWASPLASLVSPDRLGQLFPLLSTVQPYCARRFGPPLRPQQMELRRNSRARSAMVHCFVKEPRRPPFQRLSRSLPLESASKSKPGDWLCVSCRSENMAAQQICHECVTSYGEISTALGRPWTPRLVGQALKKNPHAPTVPCHRVVKADRSLGGYFGATSLEDERMKTKVQLLESEGVHFQNEATVSTECFWHFPKKLDLDAVELPAPAPKHRRTCDSQVKAEDATQAEKKTPLLKGGDTLGGTWGMHLQ